MGFFDSLLKLGTSGVLGAAGSLISGGMSMIGQNSNIDKQIKAQAAENDRFRQYSTELAEKQNQWNIDQWNRENEYNDPSQVRNRFINAGFNPNLIAGSISGQSVSSAVGSGTSGSDVSQDMSSLGQKMTVGQMIQQTLQNEAAMASIANIKADTKKKESESKGQDEQNRILKSDADFRDALNEGALELQNVNIEFGAKNNSWIDYMRPAELEQLRASTRKLSTECTSLFQSMRESAARIADLRASKKLKDLDALWYDRKSQAAIKQALASANLSNAQAKVASEQAKIIFDLMFSEKQVNEANIKLADAKGKEIGSATLKLDKETEMLNVSIGYLEDYGDMDHIINYIESITTGAANAARAASLGKALLRGSSVPVIF